ncbi:uncharacterized protein LOC105437798 isoform X2 [Strongylocentrotus purpuratus]|nr:uncharacterized protein LOC105437798 isoform X2 [Strongylocentrotus purpuratus]
MDKYVIVEFLDTKEVEVVSSKWLGTNDGRQSCRWPPCDAASAKNAVMRHDPPEDTWPWFTCEVQEGGSTASYDKARKKLSKAENCLPLATTDDEHVGRRRVGRPGRFRESSDDEPELVVKRAKKLTSPRPSPPAFPGNTSSRSSTHSTPTTSRTSGPETPTTSRAPGLDTPTISRTPGPDTPTTSNAINPAPPQISVQQFEHSVIRLLNEIKQQGRQNATMMQSLLNTRGQSVEADTMDMGEEAHLPVSNITELEQLNEQLKAKPFKKKLIKSLGTLGGTTEKEVVARILKAMLEDELATNLNWKGMGQKVGICKMDIADVILRATRRSWESAPNTSTEDLIKKWLRYSSDRSGGRRKREEKKKAAALIEIEEGNDPNNESDVGADEEDSD